MLLHYFSHSTVVIYNCRLKALRDAAGEKVEGQESKQPGEPALKFRNYSVRDQKIEHTVLAPALPPEYKAPEVEAAVKKQVMPLIKLWLLTFHRAS